MLLLPLLVALGFAGAYFVIGAVFDTHQDDSVAPVACVALVGFVVSSFIGWLRVWIDTPTLNFGNIWSLVLINVLIFMILTIIKNAIVQYDSNSNTINGSSIAFVAFFVVWALFGSVMAIGRPWGDQAYRLAKLANVHEEEVGMYPPTDTEHIGLMPEEAAQFKADQALTQGQGKNANLSTQYDVGNAAKQKINDHLYWIFELRLNGWRNANYLNRIVPGYIVVDAENPEAQPQLKLDFHMKYTPGAPTGNSLDRLIWTKYKNYSVSDLTLEVNDDWQPYYTASLNRPAYSFGPTVPVKAIVVDPQTGSIKPYQIKDVPAWVDRIYSASTAKQMMNWWGSYGQGPDVTPRKFLGIQQRTNNRFKVAGDPVLVYASDGDTGHPEWQMLLTSFKSDTAANFVALFDARGNDVRLYRVPNLQTEHAVLSAFETARDNVKKFTPTDLSMHKIYGRLTWVAEYVPNAETNGPRSLQALGLLAADDAQGINVQMGSTKADVLTSYRLWLVSSTNNASPNADSKISSTSGTVARVTNVVISGNTTIYLILDNDPKHVFRGAVNDKLPELPFAAPGAKVSITYSDVGNNATVDIIGYDDAGLQLANIK